jgi:crotonyl-CoA carboxylase/reductase
VGLGSPEIVALLVASVLALAAFVAVERRVRAAMVDFSFFRSRTFLGANVVAFVVSFAMLAMFFFIALYMQNVLGYSAVEAGVRFLPATALIIVTAPIAGRLVDRVGPRPLLVTGLSLVALALLLQTRIDESSGYGLLLPAFVVMGVGMGLTMTPMSTAGMNAVSADKAGVASGILSMSRMVGGTFGVAALGALFQGLARDRLAATLSGTGVDAAQREQIVRNLGRRHGVRARPHRRGAGRPRGARGLRARAQQRHVALDRHGWPGRSPRWCSSSGAACGPSARSRGLSGRPRRSAPERRGRPHGAAAPKARPAFAPVAWRAQTTFREELSAEMAVDVTKVSELDVEPGTLPGSMAAWVIRQEREGEPRDAFQLEQIEVPEPAAFEVIVRVMAAGVNYNNVWAALGVPVSVFRYHPDEDHHIGGSDASGVVWKVGPGVTRWKPGDEVVLHCNQASYEDPEVHGLDPLAAPSQKIWGYETSWGSFAQFTKVQAQQLLPKPHNLTWEEAACYGLVYFTAYRMLVDQCELQAGHRVLVWGAAGGLGVFAVQLCAMTGAQAVGVVSSGEKGELVKQLGAVGYIDRREYMGMMRRGGESAEEEAARFKESRRFAKRVEELLGEAPDIVFEHVGKATFPASVLTVRPFGKVVICAGTTGYNLDFDVRYLWMRQKQIIGSHFANAYECMKANDLIEQGLIRPVLWRTMGFDGVAEAHQIMRENQHLGKIAILVGAEREGLGKTAEGPGAIYAEVGA